MYKKYLKILLLAGLTLIPLKIDALADTLKIQENGHVNPLYADYNWWDGNTESGYLRGELKNGKLVLTAEAKKGKYNIECNQNNYQYWYYTCQSTCGIDITKLSSSWQNQISSCGKTTRWGLTKSLSQKNCKESAIGTNKAYCNLKSGGQMRFNISESNFINHESHCGNEAGYIDQVRYGKWAKDLNMDSASNKSYTKAPNIKRYYCTWSSSTTGTTQTSKKKLVQNQYQTSDGAAAYCVNPGRIFKAQNYKLAAEYDVSKKACTKSNSDKSCALAAAVMIGNQEYNGDYLTILTALRFLSAHYGDNEGWWDSASSKKYSNANIYKHTVDEITNYGYAGGTTKTKIGVIYADSTSSTALANAILIYKKVMSGYDMWSPSVTHKHSSYNTYTKTATLSFESNFPTGTTISSIKLSNGKEIPAGNITSAPCESDNSKMCITATIQLEANECVKVKAEIFYTNPYDTISKIGYYKAIDNPSKYQDMYVFDRNAKASVMVTKKTGTNNNASTQEFDLCAPDNSCSIAPGGKYICKDGSECTKERFSEECEEPTDNTYCPKPELEENMPDDCEDSTTGRIEDATMCNILNSEDKYKEEYRKTEYENEFCKVYCRETLIFSFMDKETAYAGQAFQHSVGSYYSGKAYLSTVILSRKQCSSEVNYDNWLAQYKQADANVLSTWNTLKEWEAFYNLNGGTYTDYETDDGCSADHCSCPAGAKIYMEWSYASFNTTNANGYTSMSGEHTKTRSSSSSRCRSGSHSCRCCPSTDKDGKTTWGSEWCETCSCSCASDADAGYVSRNYSRALNNYKNALEYRDKLLYQIQDCNFMSDNNSNNRGITTTAVYTKNKYGPYYTTSANGNHTTGANLKTYKSIVNGYKPGNTIEIDYEENYGYGENYDVDIVNEQTKNYAVTIGYSDKEAWKDYCKGDCDGSLYDLSRTPYLTDATDNINYWTCTGSETSARCTKNTLVIPKNKLANIVVETETVHYQDAEFYTQVFTGKTSTNKDNVGYWIELDKHIYPVGVTRLTGNYGIKLDYSDLGESGKPNNRHMSDGKYTCSYDVINELTIYDCNDGYHVCYPCSGTEEECEDYNYATGLGVYFRNINLSDIFPNSKFSPNYSDLNKNTRNIGQNWLTTNAIQIIDEIQKYGENVWTKKEPMYSITLSHDAMKTIRNYNSNSNYLDYSLNCDENLRCTSTFLNEFRAKYSNLFSKNVNIPSNNLYYYKRSW